MIRTIQTDWFSNVRNDLLAGVVVALALIPEAIAFSIIAGVDPKVGLYASFCIATVIAFTGGRPGMISAATGAMALVMVMLVKDHGLQYLLVATLLTGVLQIIAGLLQLGKLMRFVSRSVITGFVNALAILIFMAQLPELTNVTWHVYAMVAAGLGIIYLLPYITKAIPSPLVAIVALTVFSVFMGMDIRTVGDMGQLPDSLPVFLIPDVPWTWETLQIVFPVSLTLAVVGLLESMMTAQIVDDLTDTPSNKNRECIGQGVANITSGFIGGMAGCAMIGQSVINIKSGGRGRLSALAAGVFLLIMVVFIGDYVAMIPMAALVAVMIMVSIGTFNWASIRNLREHPKSSSMVMLATVAVTVGTHDLAQGVLVGVLLSGFFFANKVGRILRVQSSTQNEGRNRTYVISGQVFFASAENFINSFDYKEVIDEVTIDVSRAHFWDITAVSALDKAVIKFKREGTEVEVIGMNEASRTLVDKFAIHDKDDALERMTAH
ncbi:MAG: SulP family inorganic anion transporter [Gammaproteobacteria bacterium]|uniref:SulP family inorganic anion transporter n=1 Tax=Limnobacter sp. TaxID=2003368 RepID=UPI001D72EDB7|nr:SulP family inorganic anion transporter [Limnobacter sp.]MBU0782558.1 SulP family inorganic anion transporter [Gammaproteobacteria bacterium]MBU0850146.1 SulP family inorganic anion transporter [Gammaproteobacteria bacterium]MBU1268634.1 SulP family inorganic anion transporter [Gammaproteobacteria bacterium]MBU1530058.1 SulP family inorganic anion transporter [Gammaproteobacteria bacterium]MBU1780883.1 SulP family inorganic anion transporter [Gammaproteobacteria bacterium]